MTFLLALWLFAVSSSRAGEINKKQDHQAAFPPLPLLDTRADLGDVLERENKTVGVELGVQRGEFAAEVLSRWPKCRKYYLVDLWTHQDNYNDTANVATDAQEAYMNEAKDKLRHWQDKTVWMRMLTSDAAREIPDNSVDFVYIDARHDYCGVSEDLSLYWPKLRVGGIMAGHDYLTDTEMKDIQPHTDWSLCSDGTRHSGAVKKAVSDFVRSHNLTVVSTKPQKWKNPSFATRKV
uniref:Methyltransferase domain-containing protein n=1 Tax=Vitrella brassicaformis TaxID=1169539 RepID=A0A7S1P4D4_9ALVE|mmetsp:Transcript_31706/g.78558  ORF Transcript_31706/g.78558 Transcript_31706/m.78558 type:complete len:236 (+) Transcript_31706:126-833(+)